MVAIVAYVAQRLRLGICCVSRGSGALAPRSRCKSCGRHAAALASGAQRGEHAWP